MAILIRNRITFSPFEFYTTFLTEVADEIRKQKSIEFKLVEFGDENVYNSSYWINPITLPLLLSLFEQLSKFYGAPLPLYLYNNIATEKILRFLYQSDFFYIVGNNQNPTFPRGRNILKFDERYLGNFRNKRQRKQHKVASFSLNDYGLKAECDLLISEDQKRDLLISRYSYITKDLFYELLIDNPNTIENTDYYIEILSELITNGVLHSKSETYALMFVDGFNTIFSISDNGIGFKESLYKKQESYLYKPGELVNKLTESEHLRTNIKSIDNLRFIIEALYFSSLKERYGLFDLMLSVVLKSGGRFRLHYENAQIIVSKRLNKDLTELSDLRKQIFDLHKQAKESGLSKKTKPKILILKEEIKTKFLKFYANLCGKYNTDFKYSSLRFYNIRFNGVHIEVEIPQNQDEDDNI